MVSVYNYLASGSIWNLENRCAIVVSLFTLSSMPQYKKNAHWDILWKEKVKEHIKLETHCTSNASKLHSERTVY